jgi:hypothetical protein
MTTEERIYVMQIHIDYALLLNQRNAEIDALKSYIATTTNKCTFSTWIKSKFKAFYEFNHRTTDNF